MEWIRKMLNTKSGTLVVLGITIFLLGCTVSTLAINPEFLSDVYKEYRRGRDSTEIVGFNEKLDNVAYETGENSYKYDHLKEVFKDHQKEDIRFRDKLDVKFESIDTKQDAIIRQLERMIGALHGQGIRVADGD